MRVLFIVAQYPPPVVGGLERQAQELGISLVNLGVEVMVVSQSMDRSQPRREMRNGITVLRVPVDLPSPWRPIQLAIGLIRIMFKERRNFDVVHLHSISRLGTASIVLAKMLGKPVLAKLPGAGTSGIQGQATRRFGRLWRAVFRQADAIVAMSEESVEELRQIGFPKERVFHVSNGVSVERFSSQHGVARLRGRVRVIYVGRLLQRKGVLDLVSAWAQVVRIYDVDARLEVCGSGPAELQMQELARELGIEHTIEFRGWANDLAPILCGADIFVLPSYGEGNSNAVLEAMASGLPVVSTCVGGTPALVGAQGARWLVRPGDTVGLAQRITSLVLDAETRTCVGRAMRTRAREHFDISDVAERYISAYRHLISGDRDHMALLAEGPTQV